MTKKRYILAFVLGIALSWVRLPAQSVTWQLLESYPGEGFENMTIDTEGRIFVNTGPYSTGGRYRGFRSTDDGRTWTELGQGGHYAVTPSGYLIAAIRNVIFRSSDHGETWSDSIIVSQGKKINIEGITVSSSGHLFILTFNDKFYRSTDDGMNWRKLGNDLQDTAILALTSSTTGTLYVGTPTGMYVSINNGETLELRKSWSDTPVISLHVGREGSLFAGLEHYGVSRSSDQGYTWEGPEAWTIMSHRTVYSMASSDRYLFATTATQGILVSVDTGTTWQQANEGIGADVFNFLDLEASTRGYVVTGAYGGKVYKSSRISSSDPIDIHTGQRTFQNITVLPNPLSSRATVQCRVDMADRVVIAIHDMLGQEILTLYDGMVSPGEYMFDIDGSNLPAGVYSCSYTTSTYRSVSRLIVVK